MSDSGVHAGRMQAIKGVDASSLLMLALSVVGSLSFGCLSAMSFDLIPFYGLLAMGAMVLFGGLMLLCLFSLLVYARQLGKPEFK
jgi:hypothetical protein